MNNNLELNVNLKDILSRYQSSFTQKIYSDENNDYDVLMKVFSLTPEIKRENRQYWGRELGMCWQLLITEIFKHTRADFSPALRFGGDEPCDLISGNQAIDTKYRIGSGDSGTLKKFKSYGPMLIENGYTPVLLILREDNLPAAITACRKGEWNIYVGDNTFDFIQDLTGFDLKSYLIQMEGAFAVIR